jgi:hypothetical protein
MNQLIDLTRGLANLPPPPGARIQTNTEPSAMMTSGSIPESTPAPVFPSPDDAPDPLDDPLFDVDDPSYMPRVAGSSREDGVIGALGTYGGSPPAPAAASIATTPAPTATPEVTQLPLPPPSPTPPPVQDDDAGGMFGLTQVQMIVIAVACIIACILVLVIAFAIPGTSSSGDLGGLSMSTPDFLGSGSGLGSGLGSSLGGIGSGYGPTGF